MAGDDLKIRTKQFALRVVQMVESLPRTRTADVFGKQLLRSATSVGANYRSACRSRSSPDFVSRITIAEEEADESLYWMELIVESKMLPSTRLTSLMQEANELTAIFASSAKTAKRNIKVKTAPRKI